MVALSFFLSSVNIGNITSSVWRVTGLVSQLFSILNDNHVVALSKRSPTSVIPFHILFVKSAGAVEYTDCSFA